MNVSRISFCANPLQTDTSTASQTEEKPVGAVKTAVPYAEPKPENKSKKKSAWDEIGIKEPHPAVIGVGSAALWFAIGAVIDKGISKVWKGYQYNRNSSLKLNAGFGAIMGAIDAYRAYKSQI